MNTLAEIEAAADRLPLPEQEALRAHLAMRLGRGATQTQGERVRLPLIDCGAPGSLPIDEDLIARIETETDAERHAASV